MPKIQWPEPEKLAKRVLYLAWKASRIHGAGVLQDRPQSTEQEVWDNVVGKGDYPHHPLAGDRKNLNADYVFGRMMKLPLTLSADSVAYPDGDPVPDYQSWAGRYPTYDALFNHAAASLGAGEVF